MPMMKSIAFIVVCYLVLILTKGKWNKLTGHPNDRENNQPKFEVEFSPTKGE